MCYWPGLLGNATTDICCFETYDCSEQVCGAQNVSVIYGNGTSYCYLNATIAEIKFNQVGNETCKMMGCEYLQSVKNAANGGSAAQTMVGGHVWMSWFFALFILGMISRKAH
ncbi:hypothetical protein I317_03063 [Kwoniella heveanensis CBS 569]|nr:hypothetical protein I317_03063 [Kwoniella heveanensis CBS 569]